MSRGVALLAAAALLYLAGAADAAGWMLTGTDPLTLLGFGLACHAGSGLP